MDKFIYPEDYFGEEDLLSCKKEKQIFLMEGRSIPSIGPSEVQRIVVNLLQRFVNVSNERIIRKGDIFIGNERCNWAAFCDQKNHMIYYHVGNMVAAIFNRARELALLNSRTVIYMVLEIMGHERRHLVQSDPDSYNFQNEDQRTDLPCEIDARCAGFYFAKKIIGF